jgi:Domain of unknown function (DUF4267)
MLYAGIALVILASVGIIAVGIRYVLAPAASAKTFGLPAWPDGRSLGWLNLKGVRDIVSGLVLLVPLALGEIRLVGLLMFVAAITPLGDAITILRHKGNKTLAYAVHGATALGVVIAGVLLLLS